MSNKEVRYQYGSSGLKGMPQCCSAGVIVAAHLPKQESRHVSALHIPLSPWYKEEDTIEAMFAAFEKRATWYRGYEGRLMMSSYPMLALTKREALLVTFMPAFRKAITTRGGDTSFHGGEAYAPRIYTYTYSEPDPAYSVESGHTYAIRTFKKARLGICSFMKESWGLSVHVRAKKKYKVYFGGITISDEQLQKAILAYKELFVSIQERENYVKEKYNVGKSTR